MGCQWAASGLPVGSIFSKILVSNLKWLFGFFQSIERFGSPSMAESFQACFSSCRQLSNVYPVCKTDCDANILSIHKKKRKEKKIGQIKKSQNTLPLY
jgi:hypothetical protein